MAPSPQGFVSFGSRPEILRCVSKGSFLLSGQTVEMTGQSSRESGLVGVRTRGGALYDLPKEFLLRPGEPEPEPIKLTPDVHRAPKRAKEQEAPVEPESPHAFATAPSLAAPAQKPMPESNLLPDSKPMTGQAIKKLTSGEEVIVARDGTYRPVTTSAYRGLRAVAAQQALGKQWGTRAELGCVSGMVRVTLVQPPRRDAESIRAEVLRKIVAAATDGEFLSVCQKLRANRAERSLADRIRALRNVGTSADEWEVRSRVGVTISEIRSR